MNSSEIRQKFLAFFEKRGHKIIPSASLVPENDPSVLFTTAGMQPLVPYLLGAPHPAGTRLCDVQKCVRTGDLDEVGDNTHATFFEMLGNWSLGDYFKEEAIRWSYELLTSKEEGFGLDPKRLYVTVFAGNDEVPRDDESKAIWMNVGIPENRIYFLSADSNFWSPGDNGPCGPCSEMFYDVTEAGLGDLSPEEYNAADARRDVVEIWNDVFMQFEKKDGKVIGKLAKHNVDTGAGLERVAMVLQNKNNIYDTDLNSDIVAEISKLTTTNDQRAKRIICDHLKASVFMIADGVTPSNTDRGYVLRRLLRRAVRYADVLGLPAGFLSTLVHIVIAKYVHAYDKLANQTEEIKNQITAEELRFRETAKKGFTEFNRRLDKNGTLSTKDIFDLYQSFGLTKDQVIETVNEIREISAESIKHGVIKDIIFDEKEFSEMVRRHQELSRAGAGEKFKGGLGGESEQIIKYHTATHLLHQALRDVLGESVGQKGSNITEERLRFDFTFDNKMTPEQISKVEEIVNAKITENLPVTRLDLPKEEAEKTGALHFFGEKYGDIVSVYYIGNSLGEAYSKEFCGGPHTANTGVLGHFKIIKEEAVAKGIRRIKAVLE